MKKCFAKTSFPLTTLPQERVSKLAQKIDVLSEKLPEKQCSEESKRTFTKNKFFRKKLLCLCCQTVQVFTY